MKVKNIKEFFEMSWFIITLPFYMLFTKQYLGGCAIPDSDFEYDMFYGMKFSTEGKISYIHTV